MIGTDRELLLFLTWKRGWHEDLDLTQYQAHKIRDNLHRNQISKEYRFELLNALGCVMLRDEVFIESVWDNGNITGSMDFLVGHIMSQWNWSAPIDWIKSPQKASNISRYFREGRISEERKEMILTSYGYKKIAPSRTLPSIWEYRPIFAKPISDYERVLQELIYNPEEV